MSRLLSILGGYVDALTVTFKNGAVSRDLETVFTAGKASAQEDDPLTVTLGSIDFEIGPKAGGMYAWQLRNDDLIVYVTTSKNIPTLRIEATALALAFYGHEAVLAMMYAVASEFDTDQATLSRIDIAIDFQGWVPDYDTVKHIICSAKRHPHFSANGDLETYAVGKAPTMMRLYDKRKEIAQSGKDWLELVWNKSPDYDPKAPVWRWEIELHRKTLKSLKVETPEDAFANLHGLVGFGLTWAELRIPQGKSTDRWPIHPAWKELASSPFAGTPTERVKATKMLTDWNRLIPIIAGCVVTMAAILNIKNFERMMEHLIHELDMYYREKGQSFAEIVRLKRHKRLFKKG